MRISRRAFTAGIAAACAAPAARRALAQSGPLKIGMVIPVTGPAAESGRYGLNGARLALGQINAAGGVLGRQIELVTEDDQTTNPGAVLAFSRLAVQSDIVAFLGSIRSTQVHAMAPDILRTAKPVMIGGTDPQLTRLGNPWLFRCRPNDTYSALVIADFGVRELNLRKWAIIHSTDAFGTGGQRALVEALAARDIQPKLVQGYTNQSPDFTPVVVAIRRADVDVIASYFTFENDLGIFARQLRQLGVTAPWIGSPSIATATARNLAGPALHGTYAIADFAEESSDTARRFMAAYREAYHVDADVFASWTFDALHVLARAIHDANSTEPQAIRTAILAIRGLQGAEGEYNFDSRGDGLHGYNVVRNQNGNIVFSRHIDLPPSP